LKTYGTYQLMPGVPASGGRAYWAVLAEPHVMMRLKRIFPRVLQQRTGAMALADTVEVARDLEWVTGRWPLAPKRDEDLQHLAKRAEGHRAQQEAVLRILGGERPDYGWRALAEPARDYQEVAAALAHATNRLLVGDDVGLGKSLTAAMLLRDSGALPALVVTQTHLPEQWQTKTFARFLPWLGTHVIQRGRPYDPTTLWVGRGRNRRRVIDQPPDVWITSYSKLPGWANEMAGQVQTVIFDEIQELRHPDTERYNAAGLVADAARYKIGLSATPIYNYGDEAHAIVSILDPEALGVREEFLREWCSGGMDDSARRSNRVRDPAALGTYLRDQGILIRRTRAEVGRELPPVTVVEQNTDIDRVTLDRLSGDAVAMARTVLDQAAKNTDRWRASAELDWRLRHATGVAKAPYVAEFVRLLLQSERNVVLWGWHRECYEIWLDRLSEFKPAMYTGTESPTQKQASVNAFRSGQSRVLIMSLRSGVGVDGLQEICSVGVFGELDWSPQVHVQAIGRLHRDGQDTPVLAYYLVSDSGSDPPVADVLELKRQQANPIMDPNAPLFQIAVTDARRSELLAKQVLRRAGVPPNGGASR
jgi:superfamily II DNA or RNA helicase